MESPISGSIPPASPTSAIEKPRASVPEASSAPSESGDGASTEASNASTYCKLEEKEMIEGGENENVFNDWRCTKCSSQNFARRQVCFKCSTERGEDAELIQVKTWKKKDGKKQASHKVLFAPLCIVQLQLLSLNT